MATHPWPLVPCITIHTSMWMAWWFCRSYQTWVHILGDLWPGWMRASLCMDCITGLSDLYNASRDMWHVCEPIHGHWSSHHNPHLPGVGIMVCKSCKTLTHIFGGMWPGWRASLCVSYIPDMWDRSYISTGHVKGVGIMVCKSCKTLTHIFGGMWPGWRASLCVSYIPGMWDHSYISTGHVKYMATHPWPLVHHIPSHTPLWMVWWSIYPAKYQHTCLGWCVNYHEIQPSIQVLTTLLIHQWVDGWGWSTIIWATKQGDHIHTGHTKHQRMYHGWAT